MHSVSIYSTWFILSTYNILGKCLNRLQPDFGKLPIIHSPTKFKKNANNNSQGIFPRKEKIIVC